MNNVLEIDSIILEFGDRRILQDVYLKCQTNTITGLLGKNGTGKSSIFKILFGDLSAPFQSVRINEKALLSSKRAPQDIRYLPQHNFIPDQLTIKRILSDFDLDFSDLITYFPELKTCYKVKLRTLSAGQRRIVEIFTILSSQTMFCLLDEPFSQIMPLHIDIIKAIILREKKNKGIIITDHMYQYVLELCDDLYVIKDGKTYLTNNIQDIEKLGYTRINDNATTR